jgi:hypothetical protein
MKMPENESAKLNPQIVDIEIGIREMRKITVYPLSMRDQLKLTDMITTAVNEQLQQSGGGDLPLMTFIIRLIQDNIGQLITMVTDEKEDVLDDMSNMQAVEVANVLFDVNYGAVSKNFKSLSEKVKGMFQSERPLPQSASDMDTDLTTSTESPTEKAA